jgi:hypothetical protein
VGYDCEYVYLLKLRGGGEVYVDARGVDNSYGLRMNDPLEGAVNAKISIVGGEHTVDEEGYISIPVKAADHIEKGKEIFISYGRKYWMCRFNSLSPELAMQVEEEYGCP